MAAQKVDVLVVGAGPAGLTAAATLRRYGVDVLVLERKQRLSEDQALFERYRYFLIQYNTVAPGKRVATVTVTNPPVNALNERAIDELGIVVDRLARADDVVAVVFTGDGFLLTNAHVIGSASDGQAAFAGGATGAFTVVGTDPLSDLAVVRADGPVPVATWRVDGRLVELPTPHVDREALVAGEPVAGPAILLQLDTTVAVPPGWAATATPEGVVLLTHDGGTRS